MSEDKTATQTRALIDWITKKFGMSMPQLADVFGISANAMYSYYQGKTISKVMYYALLGFVAERRISEQQQAAPAETPDGKPIRHIAAIDLGEINKKLMNYYNEFDPGAAAWIRQLIEWELIPNGEVDERSIADAAPRDLEGFTQCHFFAGIGGWPLALRLAGVPESTKLWTGSCPCQPFSSAGKGDGVADPRHLWPAFRWLIAQCRPSVVLGEQVASKAGRSWGAGVRDDLEALGYGFGAADICAAGVNAPHVRQRLWWGAANLGGDVGRMADGEQQRPEGWLRGRSDSERQDLDGHAGRGGEPERMADDDARRREEQCGAGAVQEVEQRQAPSARLELYGDLRRMADQPSQRPDRGGEDGAGEQPVLPGQRRTFGGMADGDDRRDGGELDGEAEIREPECRCAYDPWAKSAYWPCRDGKFRRVPDEIAEYSEAEVESLLQLVVDGLSESVGVGRADLGVSAEELQEVAWAAVTAFPLAGRPNPRRVPMNPLLKGAGNAIVPQVAALFVQEFFAALAETHPQT